MSLKFADAVKKAKRVYIIGNGGSYANAVHICNDLLGCGVKAYTLDPATLTATANDFSYSEVFSKWITTVGEPGDLLVALSGSGKSPNIVNAVQAAQKIGMETYCIFGAFNPHGGENVFTAGKDMQRAEEYQVVLGHEVMKCLKSIS